MSSDTTPATAVVVGSGPAGLMAAAVCARHVADVRLLEPPDHESGASRPEHIHTLLASAWSRLEQWFPGIIAEISAVAPVLDWGTELIRDTDEGIGAYCESGIQTPFCSRTLLQKALRTRVNALPEVRRVFLPDLLTPSDWTPRELARVAGLSEPPDLVLDATGANAAMLDSGLCKPAEPVRLQAGDPAIRYHSWCRDEPEATSAAPACFVLRTIGGTLSGAMTIPIEGSRRLYSVATTNDTTPAPDTCAAALHSEPLARTLGDTKTPWTHTGTTVFPGSFMIEIRSPGDWPAGWLPIGDTLGRATPVLGLGLSDATAMLARLDELLARHTSTIALTRRYIRQARTVKRNAFNRARVLADLIRSSGEGTPIPARLRSHAARSILAAASRSPSFNRRYLAWRHGLHGPGSLILHPAFLASALTHR